MKNLNGTNDLRFDPQSGLTLGAAVNMNRVIASPEVQAHYPLLAEACRSVASYQLRTRATVVGNICNASPAGDTIGACLALDGTLHIHGIRWPATGIARIIFPWTRQNHAETRRCRDGDPLPHPAKEMLGDIYQARAESIERPVHCRCDGSGSSRHQLPIRLSLPPRACFCCPSALRAGRG